MKINWLKHYPIYFLLSALIIIPGIYSLARFGLNLSVDFTGGTQLELKITPKDQAKLMEVVKEDYQTAQITSRGDVEVLNLPPIDQSQATQLKDKLSKNFEKVEEVSFTTVGPTIGRELLIKTITALCIAVLLILAYVARAFKDLKFGIAAVLAMLHDTLVLLGAFSLLG